MIFNQIESVNDSSKRVYNTLEKNTLEKTRTVDHTPPPESPLQKKRIIGGDDMEISPTRIAVMGVGGGGVNAVSSIVDTNYEHIDLWAANTDIQTLRTCSVENVIQLGAKTCKGLGVGGYPEKGAEAAREIEDKLREVIVEYDMIFLATGLGGGTGSGAIPIIAEIAKESGVLVVSVVTMPFHFEGIQRESNAEYGLKELERNTDALIIIPNNKMLSSQPTHTNINVEDSFLEINKILSDTVLSITDILTKPGKINIDFADIKACLKSSGLVTVGFGESNIEESQGGNAHRAAEMALTNTFLSEENAEVLSHANNVIINVVGGTSFPIQDYTAIADIVTSRANIKPKFLKKGYRFEPSWDHKVQVTVIASSDQFQNIHATKNSASFDSMEDTALYARKQEQIQSKKEHTQEDFSRKSIPMNEVQHEERRDYVSSDMFSEMLRKGDDNLDEFFEEELAKSNNKTAIQRNAHLFESENQYV